MDVGTINNGINPLIDKWESVRKYTRIRRLIFLVTHFFQTNVFSQSLSYNSSHCQFSYFKYNPGYYLIFYSSEHYEHISGTRFYKYL